MNHDLKCLKDILDKYKVINVPYYQREYVWGSKNNGRNLYKFIDDIFTQYDTNPESNYFIGTLAFCSDRVNDVIDGQQRLTSLILILSRLSAKKCSTDKKEENQKILFPDSNRFVIEEPNYLTEELKCRLGFSSSYNTAGPSADISKTIDQIDKQISMSWSSKTVSWYDGLYEFILNKVYFIFLEYTNIGESLKYFLNINSLSVPLTQSDIFYSILSQSIRIAGSTRNIFTIKKTIEDYTKQYKGINEKISGYNYEQDSDRGVNNIIFIFLNAYYQRHKDSGFSGANDAECETIKSVGIGKWISFYQNSVFKEPIEAKKFVDKFMDYLTDFKYIYEKFANVSSTLDIKSPLYMSWILLQYEGYKDVIEVLVKLFRVRHNYVDDSNGRSLYKDGTKKIDDDQLYEIAKRLNLTLFVNYIKASSKRVAGFITNISVDLNKNYKTTIKDILININLEDIFNLSYNDKKGEGNTALPDQSRIIKVIFAFQEAYLNMTANVGDAINKYLKSLLLSNNFTIEHLYSVKEYSDISRRNNWQTLQHKFSIASDFDTERFKFENLSLLDMSTNSSASDDEIRNKLTKYQRAKQVNDSDWEYLILSLVDDSVFYRNPNITALGLPKRTLKNINQNTWELSEHNREFNIELLKKVLNEMAK